MVTKKYPNVHLSQQSNAAGVTCLEGPVPHQRATAAGTADVTNIHISTMQHKDRQQLRADCCRALQIQFNPLCCDEEEDLGLSAQFPT